MVRQEAGDSLRRHFKSSSLKKTKSLLTRLHRAACKAPDISVSTAETEAWWWLFEDEK